MYNYMCTMSSVPFNTCLLPTFCEQVQPLNDKEMAVTTGVYVRSGLLGFVGNVNLYLCCTYMCMYVCIIHIHTSICMYIIYVHYCNLHCSLDSIT